MTIHGEVVRLEPAHGFGFIRDDRRGDWFFVADGVRVGRAGQPVGRRAGGLRAGAHAERSARDRHPPRVRRVTARLLLFDIDGTLVLTGGAGKRAMDRAFQELFGVADAFAGVSMAGRTDRFLWSRGSSAAACRRPPTRSTRVARRATSRRLAEAIARARRRARKAMMPGVTRAARRARHARRTCSCALLTGNYEAGARIKLEHFGLWGASPGAPSATTTPSATCWPGPPWPMRRAAA